MTQKIPTLNNQRLETETSTERNEALKVATSLAFLCGGTKRTDLGYGNTIFYLDFDLAYNKTHHGRHDYRRPRIVVGPDNTVKYFAGEVNVDNLHLVIRQLRQFCADLTFYDDWLARKTRQQTIHRDNEDR